MEITAYGIRLHNSDEADAGEVLDLQKLAYQSEAALNSDFSIQPLTQTLDELIAEYRNGVVLKAELNGEIIGSVRAYEKGSTVYIGKLIVHPSHQGKGLGKRLLMEIEGKFFKKRFELFTSGRSERNLRLYEKAGYKRFKEETTESGITLVYMEKKVEGDASLALGLCFGTALGSTIGTMTNDISFWLPLGIAIGLAFGVSFKMGAPKPVK
jgi:ribosomal protein S18 acetylase RimI-like enzyme